MGHCSWGMSSVARRNGNPLSRWANAGFRSVKRAAPYALQAYKSYKRFAPSRTNGSSGRSTRSNTVSFQHDFSSQYNRKRAPRRVRKRAIKQAKMFNYQLGKQEPQTSRMFNFIYAPSTITPTSFANSQTVYNVGIYGGNPTSTTGMDTWYQCVLDIGLMQSTGRVLCKSAVLNCQIQNTDSTSTLVVDAYKYVARREGYDEPGAEWAQNLANQGIASGSANALTTSSFECTPFDAPGFGSKYLILQKTKYRIGPGNSVYLQMRDPRNYAFESARFDFDIGPVTPRMHMFKGMTKGWIFVARSAVTDATSSFGGPVNWKVIQSQSYHFAYLSNPEDRQGQN